MFKEWQLRLIGFYFMAQRETSGERECMSMRVRSQSHDYIWEEQAFHEDETVDVLEKNSVVFKVGLANTSLSGNLILQTLY